MYETMVTLVGNAATAVEHRQTTTGASTVRFRLATSTRRWDKERGCWADGDPSFYTVRAWRALADHVAASVSRGEPLVVHGRMRVWERELPEEKGGQRRVSVEVDAVAVGHDLSRGTSAFRRITRVRTELTQPAGQPGAAEAPRGPGAPAPEPSESGAPKAPAHDPTAAPDWSSPPGEDERGDPRSPAAGPREETAIAAL
ncbi:single-stranded DNA-binding protein [Streptomyces sp. NPDC059788]|uniref:single-stranded DNA-binding protein n=1 Tax=Streptomyces sp. NPDC059788 TaxID=3346948 RepID=UPI0036629AE8